MSDNREDHLSNFIKGKESEQPNNILPDNKEYFGNSFKQKVETIEAVSEWIEIPLKDLPFGKFYKDGTHVFIRPAKTKEIESFAIINEANPYDVQLKMNEMLSACTKVVFADGSQGTYKDLQSGDRETFIIIISKATSKSGRVLNKAAYCNCSAGDKSEVLIDLVPANYVYPNEDEDIKPFFDDINKVYRFVLYNDIVINIAPPTIGLSEDINNYIFYETTKSKGEKVPNVTFMQTIPYVLAGKGIKSMNLELVGQEEYNFSKMNDEVFMFIYDTIDKMSFGISKLKGKCPKCSLEVYTTFGFPNGARSLFIVPNAFKQFIKQPI